MKKAKKIIAILVATVMALAIPVTAQAKSLMDNVKVEGQSTITPRKLAYATSGDLQGRQVVTKTFYMPYTTQDVMITASSSAMEGSGKAPIGVYIDGFKVGSTAGDGNPVVFTRGPIAQGIRTINIQNESSLWLAYAVEINYY